MMRIKYKKYICFLAIIYGLQSLTGCQSVAEPQNRNYIMSIGVDDSDSEGVFQFEYSFPDLALLTGTDANENEAVRTVKAKNLKEAARQLNAVSDKISDYSQLSVIIIGEKVYRDEEKLRSILQLMKDENAIRRTVMIAFAKEKAEDIMALDDDVNGSIAVFLYELCQNNYERDGYRLAVLEDFVGGSYTEKTHIPIFEERENRPVLADFIALNVFWSSGDAERQ